MKFSQLRHQEGNNYITNGYDNNYYLYHTALLRKFCKSMTANIILKLLSVWNGSWSPKVSVPTEKCPEAGEVEESPRTWSKVSSTEGVSVHMHCMQGTENADFSPFHSQDLIFNSPLCLLYYNTYGDGSENLALDQLITTLLIFFIYSHYLSAWYWSDYVERNSL